MPYKAGDKVTIRGEEYRIMKLGKKAHLKDELTGKKKIIELNELIR
jgi:hypothetical protein